MPTNVKVYVKLFFVLLVNIVRSQVQGAAQKRISDKHSEDFKISTDRLYSSNYISMNSSLILFLFLVFAIGVFGDTDGRISVSVMEGDSVTLIAGVSEIQSKDVIEWRFNGERVAKISSNEASTDGSRLQLDRQTGDLNITNIKTTNSGEYTLKIRRSNGSSDMAFSVSVVSADEVKPVTVEVTVLEGDSVSLNTDPTYIQQRDDVIQWRFGQQKSPVAEINRMAGILNTYDGPDGRFRDRLQLDNQTGSLIITDIRTTDSGLYEADISSTSSRYTIHHTQSFSVTISDEMKSVSVKEGESVTLQTVTEIQKDDLIHWMFGDTVIAEIRKADQRFYTSDVPDERFSGRLKLDRQTGSLTITNTRITDSGDYQLKISSSRRTINRRIPVTVTDSGLSPAAITWIVVGVIVLLVAVGGVIYYCMKSKRRRLMYAHGPNLPFFPPEEDQAPPSLQNGETELAKKPVETENNSSL